MTSAGAKRRNIYYAEHLANSRRQANGHLLQPYAGPKCSPK